MLTDAELFDELRAIDLGYLLNLHDLGRRFQAFRGHEKRLAQHLGLTTARVHLYQKLGRMSSAEVQALPHAEVLTWIKRLNAKYQVTSCV